MSSLDEFLKLVADQLGGSTRRVGKQIELVLPEREPIILDSEVEQNTVSSERLLFVEKQAASVLAAPAVLFAAELNNAGRNRRTILRVAFGYHLLNGRPCFRRYTSYFELAHKQARTIRGDDNLFAERSPSVRERKPDFSLIETHISALGRQITEVYEDYLNDAGVKTELRTIADRRRAELFELDLLYNRKSQRHLRTYGINPERPGEKPPSPSDEFRRKRALVYERHVPLVAVKVLSIGTVLTPTDGKKVLLGLPFVHGIDESCWLPAE